MNRSPRSGSTSISETISASIAAATISTVWSNSSRRSARAPRSGARCGARARRRDLAQRQAKQKRVPGRLEALGPDAAAVQLDDAARDREPEPGALDLAARRAGGARKKRSNTRGRSSGGMPGPSSSTDARSTPRRGAWRARRTLAARRRELDRVADQVEEQRGAAGRDRPRPRGPGRLASSMRDARAASATGCERVERLAAPARSRSKRASRSGRCAGLERATGRACRSTSRARRSHSSLMMPRKRSRGACGFVERVEQRLGVGLDRGQRAADLVRHHRHQAGRGLLVAR